MQKTLHFGFLYLTCLIKLMKLNHPALTDLLQMAYSAEKAADFAYQGNSGSVSDAEEKKAVRQIEIDEWPI